MNDTEMALIAEKHGWLWSRTTGRYYAYVDAADGPKGSEHRVVMAWYDQESDSMKLTDAGAFRVLVEATIHMWWDYDPAAYDTPCWDASIYVEGDTHKVGRHKDPHTAVAMARLAQLREG